MCLMTPSMGLLPKRRRFLLGTAPLLAALGGLQPLAAAAARAKGSAQGTQPDGTAGAGLAPGVAGRALEFPRDHGAHTDFRTEWWYITGMAYRAGRDEQADADIAATREPDYGFQLTFFRSRVDATQGMRSNFAAKNLIFAHAAITDVKAKKLWHEQRIARSSGAEQTDLASASRRTTALTLRDWSLKRSPVASAVDPDAAEGSLYQALLPGRDIGLDLAFRNTQPLLLQGDRGLSRKGPQAAQASFYYSQPQLTARGRLSIQGKTVDVRGRAWLDHEWSEELLHPDAVGWDWIGMNLDDGSALTAFRLRTKDGGALWDGGSFRTAAQASQGKAYVFSRGDVVFRPLRQWKSALSGASYPVEWIVRTPADFYTVRALVDNQELDSRNSTGAIYWEGLSELLDSKGQRVGRGYLEMTGYAQPLKL